MDTTLYPLSRGGGKLPHGTRACKRPYHQMAHKDRTGEGVENARMASSVHGQCLA